MHYLIDNNLEKELDNFHLLSELIKIDNIIWFCLENKLNNLTYNLYLYFYDEKSNLASMFEKYINSYVESNFSIAFRFSICPLRDLYNSVSDKNALEKLEYYDLLKNNYTYEKITNEIINEPNITIDGLMNKYSISHRTAYYIKGEYDICNDSEEQYIQLRTLVRSNCNLNNAEIIETSFIRNYFLFSSSITANRLSVRLIEIIFSELLNNIQNQD